jgi:5-formyltetrahydrofolate cyclo-ligase
MSAKDELRAEARARRRALSAGHPNYAEIVARFADALHVASAAPVASYWPLKDEADPRGLAASLGIRGHSILLPRIVSSAEPLSFHLWREGDALTRNAHGAREPGVSAPRLVPGAVLVPLLAFDAAGFRLGYGGGYYDRTLAALRAQSRVLAIGVAFSGQESASLPRDPHDERLDMVVTELGVRKFGLA